METITPPIDLDKIRIKLTGLFPRVSHSGDVETVYFTKSEPHSILALKILNALKNLNIGYRYAGNLVKLPKNSDESYKLLSRPNLLAGFFADHLEFYDQDKDTYIHLPNKVLDILMSSEKFMSTLAEIKFFTNVAGFDPSFNELVGGYNQVSGIYLTDPEPLAPVFETKALDAVLADIVFKDESSKANYIASLLASLFPAKWLGDKPVTLITADQVGRGKTRAAEIAAIIRGGSLVSAKTTPFVENDAELRKSIISRVKDGQSEILIDNVKVRDGSKIISSQVLESWITSRELSDRLLGSNQIFSCPNALNYTLVANASNFSKDILSRSMIIDLHFNGHSDDIKRKSNRPLELALENRKKILAELKGMVVRWLDKGSPRSTVQARFRDYAEVIGGILEVAGYKGFLTNTREAESSLSDELSDLQYLIETNPSFSGAPKDWAEYADCKKVLKAELGRSKGSGRARTMSAILTRYIGRQFVVNETGDQVALKQIPNANNNGKEFCLEPVGTP